MRPSTFVEGMQVQLTTKRSAEAAEHDVRVFKSDA
jgi:hypothetical protein